jgi:hypothetical protein
MVLGAGGFNAGNGSVVITPLPPSCSSILTNAVPMPTLGGNSASTNGQPTTITATFTPQAGVTSLAAAAADCSINGYTLKGFNWESTITQLPSPSPFFAATDPCVEITPTYAFVCTSLSTPSLLYPSGISDPPQGGYAGIPSTAGRFPFYWPEAMLSFIGYPCASSVPGCAVETTNSLAFFDNPQDVCLPGVRSASELLDVSALIALGKLPFGCLAGDKGLNQAFTTQLVGVSTSGALVPLVDLGLNPGTDSFTWTDSFNGTAGGINTGAFVNPIDPGSGSGGIAILSVDGVPVGSPVPEPSAITPLIAGSSLLWLIRRRNRA